MLSKRYILVTLFAAMAIVGVTASVQIEQQRQNNDQGHNYNYGDSVVYERNIPKIEPTFFESNNSVKTASTTNTLKIPTRSVTQPIVIKTEPTSLVSAESYIVGDLNTGKIYLEKNSDEVLPFASMSKIITALVAEDMYSTTTIIEITEDNTKVAPDKSGLRAGESFTLNEIMYPLLMDSSNIAAEAVASSTDRQKFMDLMLGYSWEIGMPQSYFADPSGLSERNAGTARGFLNMARYMYDKRKSILAYTRKKEVAVATTTSHDAHNFVNIHPFVSDSRFLGGKTGHTVAAQDTMLTILNIKNRPIAFIVLKSKNRYIDTLRLQELLSFD